MLFIGLLMVSCVQAHDVLDIFRKHAAVDVNIRNISSYYQQFPTVVHLMHSIDDKSWTLHYSTSYWVHANSDQLKIHNMLVGFNPNKAGKFRSHRDCDTATNRCVASPADSLLHELLHIRYMTIVDVRSILYPTVHEGFVIEQERLLYNSMESVDCVPRPMRYHHRGELVPVSCVLCVD